MDGFNLWEAYTLLKVGNYVLLILGLYFFFKLVVMLFKNTFITHCSSDNVWKNVGLFGSAIIGLFFSGNSVVAALQNSLSIEALETAGDTIVDGLPYREILIAQIQLSFRNIIILLVIGVGAYFLYKTIVKAINRELEEYRKNVVHRRLNK